MRQRPYLAPDGYFEQLEQRLSVIPQLSPRRRFQARPVMQAAVALAACLGAALVIGSHSLRREAPLPEYMSQYEQYACADLIPRMDPYLLGEEEPSAEMYEEDAAESFAESDVISYEDIQ